MTSKKFYHDLTKFHKFECEWTFHNFSYCKNATGLPVKSDIFSTWTPNFKNMEWRIKLYCNGLDKKNEKFISIFLECLSVDADNHLKIPLDWKIILSNGLKVFRSEKFSHTFDKEKSDWGLSRYFDKLTLLNELKKTDDVVTVVCQMLFNSEHLKKDSQLSLSKDFGSLLESKKNCDVILISKEGVKHNAHKAILSCRSTVFSAMFEHDMKEKLENEIKIEDINSSVLKEMLQFVYTGKIAKVDTTKFEELFIAADKYALDDLKDICIDHFNENISDSNVLHLFEFAQYFNISSTKLKTAQYFLENKEKIMSSKRSSSLKKLSRNTLELLLLISATNKTKVVSSKNN